MDQETRNATLAQQLADASAAHAEFEATDLKGVYDQQWAEWYANYLLEHGWNEFFSKTWTGQDLAAALRQADKDHRANAPQQKWSEYYAKDFAQVE